MKLRGSDLTKISAKSEDILHPTDSFVTWKKNQQSSNLCHKKSSENKM